MRTWLDIVRKELCPGHAFESTEFEHLMPPLIDKETAIKIASSVVGCRGITCEQCWNQEIDLDEEGEE